MDIFLRLMNGGAGNLAAYLAAHVLLCLLPAFFIAGAMAALIPKASITRWLGRNAPYSVSYPAAAAAGSLLAVCSCTIVPLFAGIYKKGAGLGPAITFLFFAPAGNILALAYTGSILGAEFAFARFALSLFFGIGIGLMMAVLFWRDDASHDAQTDTLFAGQADIGAAAIGVLLSLVAVLIAGTLKLWPLTATLGTVTLPLPWAEAWQATLFQWVPFDAAKGEEGVSVQGSLLIVLLLLIGISAWKGLENIVEGANRWTWVALGLAATTLLVAALSLTPRPDGLEVTLTGRALAVSLALAAVLQPCAPARHRRLARLAVGGLALRQADLRAAGGGRVRGRHRAPADPAAMDPEPGRTQRPAGQCGGRALRRVHVLPDAGRGAGGAHVPRPGHAPRAPAGLPDGRPGAEPAEHPDGGRDHRPAQDLHLRRPGGLVQHRRRAGVRRLGGWRGAGMDHRRTRHLRRRCWWRR